MFSLNVPLPPAVSRLAAEHAPALAGFDVRPERERTLVCKRLGSPAPDEVPGIETRVQRALADARVAPFEARIREFGVFEAPPSGPAPVIHLAVESPGLRAVHDRLCEEFAPAPGVEGDDYAPHVTLARGSDDPLRTPDVASLAGCEVGPVSWTVDELVLYDARHHERVRGLSLPA